MTVYRGDGGAAHELAASLKGLRERAGLSTRALGQKVDASAAAISNWERGERLPREFQLELILTALNATEDETERLLGLRRQAEGPGQLVSGTPSIGPQLARLIEYEQAAVRITDVAPLLIPGLLQTGDYARATLGDHPDIETRVRLRIGRREVVTRTREPAHLDALIDSEALLRPIAPPHVMADQLRHLLAMADLPNVSIRLISSTAPGYNPMLAGPYILLEFPTAPPIVHVEHYQASAFIWQQQDVAGFMAGRDEIHKIAMTPADSARVIRKIAHGMETT